MQLNMDRVMAPQEQTKKNNLLFYILKLNSNLPALNTLYKAT